MTGCISGVAMKRVLLLLVLFVLVFPASLPARTWHVEKDGSGDCTKIQTCVDSAGNGDTVLVGPGSYFCELVKIDSKSDFVLKSRLGTAQTSITGDMFPCFWYLNVRGNSVIEGFTFVDCSAATGEGGALLIDSSSLTIRDNLFDCCAAGGIEGGNGHGGAIAIIGTSSGSIVKNTFYRCWAGTGGKGGALYVYSSPNLVIDRNIIAGCTGGGIWANVMPVIRCNDVWGNSPSNYLGLITDQTGINGNISSDPFFCNPNEAVFCRFLSKGDLKLRCDSPCANAPSCGQIGVFGIGCGPTSVSETSWGRIKVLFR